LTTANREAVNAALVTLATTLDDTISPDDFQRLLNASGSKDAPPRSEQDNLLNALRKIITGASDSVVGSDTQTFLDKTFSLSSFIKRNYPNGLQVQYLGNVSPTSIAQSAKTDMAYFYALKQLIP